ncbi:MAG: hypothetical protein GKR90_07145 [Pseudomonadales bacterium]|nr:hypothetical protein [Pseudomonadales bacterium]
MRILDRAVTIDGNKLNVFLTNRSNDEHQIQFDFDKSVHAVASAEIIAADDPKSTNSFADPNEVVSMPFQDVSFSGSSVQITLPPYSFAAITLLLS